MSIKSARSKPWRPAPIPLAVACSFCMTMLEDGVNARKGDQSMCVKDIAELLWDLVQASETASDKA